MLAATEALRATTSSGLRSTFCYSSIWRIKNWSSEVEYDSTLLPDWWHATLDSLAKSAPYGDGRVTLGVGFDQFQLPKEEVMRLWERSRELGVKLMTTHYVAHSMKSIPSHSSISLRVCQKKLTSDKRLRQPPLRVRSPRQIHTFFACQRHF